MSDDQEKCINGINKAGAKLAATQGKENSGCVKSAAAGDANADTCATADGKGKVAGAKSKVDDAFGKCQGGTPAFGKTTATTVKTAMVDEELALLHDVFGNPVNPNIVADETCQQSVASSAEKFGAARGKEFNSCKKAGFKAGNILTATALVNNCLTDPIDGQGSDAKGKVQKARDKVGTTVTAKCATANLATSFPGCSSEAGSAAALTTCVARKVECHMCLAISTSDGVDGKCDKHDDNTLNGTCRQCGNSVTEAGEACDDGGDSATCDFNCTTATCGDGYANAAAGEACDASGANTASCDSDCTAPLCTDGHLNTAAGEVCDDGNNTNGDGCDNNCKPTGCGNGVVTAGETCDDGNLTNGDGCDSNCTPTGCGNGIITSGETCDDGNLTSGDGCDSNCTPTGCGNGITTAPETCDTGGESATCDDDCTAPACHDGNHNAAAGEACDDGNLSNNDMCVGTCVLATCGDGFLCNTACTTGPGAGNEQCDNDGANSNVTPNACRTNCRPAFCGDNVVDAGEACDGGGVNTPTCDSNCTTAVCGDGFINTAAGETCDGGGETVSCDANCTARVCGDGTINVTAGEDCDDGNAMSGDGCSSTCQNGPGSGENDPQCPNKGELTLYSAVGTTACANNTDCNVGTCDTGLGRCVTQTSLDTGWTGISHDADINDLVKTSGRLLCEGPNSPGCGQCTVTGLLPDFTNCRCANTPNASFGNRNICDQPFVADSNDCGGNICNCYFGAPLPLSAGNTPACVVNRFSQDISGTANVDTGAGAITANLRSAVFLGETLVQPCPVCGGTCTAPVAKVGNTCGQNLDCDTTGGSGDGVCGNYDPTPGDAVRAGKCFLGLNADATCDVMAPNSTFPAPQGGGLSLDCFPTTGKNVSGQGLAISLTQTTGSVSLPAALTCGFGGAKVCPCGMCSLATGQGCRTNADCAATSSGNCIVDSLVLDKPTPNGCSDGVCNDVGGEEGECTPNSPNPGDNVNKYCDGITRADGAGFISCGTNADCDAGTIGIAAGNCTLTKTRECFLDPIDATGVMDAAKPLGVAVFCIGKTANSGINDVAGLPGPGRVINQASSRLFCASNNSFLYTPGVGGCP